MPVAQPLAILAVAVAMTHERLTRAPPLTAPRRIASSYVLVAAGFALAAV